MAARDPETGQFVGGDGPSGVDYSDFEYEHHSVVTNLTGVGSTGAAVARHSADPLEQFGGLESDELAELVALFAEVIVVPDSTIASASDNGPIRVQSTFGINIDQTEVPRLADVDETGTEVENTTGGTLSDMDLRAVTEPGVLYHLETGANAQHVNATNGTGAGADIGRSYTERFYRAVVGRGPILDPTDDLDWFVRIAIGDDEAEVNTRMAQTTVWDTSEVTDKRSRFSVP